MYGKAPNKSEEEKKYILMNFKMTFMGKNKIMAQEEKRNFEHLFNESIKDKSYQFLSDKSTAYYWYLNGIEYATKNKKI